MKARSKLWIWFGVAAAVAGFMVSMQALGMVMPWQAARADEVPSKARVNALAQDIEDLDDRTDNLDVKFAGMDGKLDTIIELLKK